MKRKEPVTIGPEWLQGIIAQGERDEETGCLIWGGMLTYNGYPYTRVNGIKKTLRRLVVEAADGKPLAAKLHPVMRCQEKTCIERSHMKLLTNKHISKVAGKLGALSGAVRRVKIAAANRKLRGKLDEAAIMHIRTSDLPGPELAKMYGLSRGYPSRIRQGKAGLLHAEGSSIFSLGAQ